MNTAFDSLTHKMQRAALGKTVDLVLSHAEKDPAKTVGQIVDLSKQFYGDSFSEETYAHAKQTLTDPNSKWSKLINCMLNQLDPNVARTTALNLGSGTFIDGFEDQIVGHTPGETFDVTVTFPEGYSDSTDSEGNTVVLSGKKAVFSVTLNYISEKVLPELTDAWVAENYGESDDVHTVEELKALYQKMLYNTNLQNAIMDDLLANSTFKELPKEVTDYQVNQCLNYYYTMANYYGYDLDSFVQTAAGYENADALLEGMSDSITTFSKEALLYQAVAETLDIVPTQEQIDTYSSYTGTYGENYCTMVALMDAVTDALTESAVVS